MNTHRSSSSYYSSSSRGRHRLAAWVPSGTEQHTSFVSESVGRWLGLLLSAVLLFGGACTSNSAGEADEGVQPADSPPVESDHDPDTSGSNQPTPSPPADRGAPPSYIPATLPERYGQELCTPEASGYVPELCEWAYGIEAVVIATVISASPTLEYAVIAGPAGSRELVAVDSCELYSTLGVHLVVEPAQWLYGSAEDGPITVYVGAKQVQEWRGFPNLAAVTDDNPLGWISGSQPAPFEVGHTVGLAITREPTHGLWSIMGVSPFTVEAEGTLVFGPRNGCYFNPPAVEEGATVEMFADQLAACAAQEPSEAARQWRFNLRGLWGSEDDPTLTHASACFPFHLMGSVPCQGDDECGEGEECIDGDCTLTWTP